MKRQTLKDVEELYSRVEYVFIATADAKGLPHIAGAGSMAALNAKSYSKNLRH